MTASLNTGLQWTPPHKDSYRPYMRVGPGPLCGIALLHCLSVERINHKIITRFLAAIAFLLMLPMAALYQTLFDSGFDTFIPFFAPHARPATWRIVGVAEIRRLPSSRLFTASLSLRGCRACSRA